MRKFFLPLPAMFLIFVLGFAFGRSVSTKPTATVTPVIAETPKPKPLADEEALPQPERAELPIKNPRRRAKAAPAAENMDDPAFPGSNLTKGDIEEAKARAIMNEAYPTQPPRAVSARSLPR